MSPSVTTVISSPYLLYSTSITSFTIARLIISHVKKSGPVPFAGILIKYNSISYSFASLLLCIAITRSFWIELSQSNHPSLETLICSPSTSDYDSALRFMYHVSKLYEYIDIFNVLAVGGPVNAHFGFHHFTTPYLTYARSIRHSTGWKIFAFLNTLHHAFMYVYFGGATVFGEVLPVTGCLQLAVGIAVELYVIWTGCAGEDALWANLLAVGLLGGYAVLFVGDLKARGKGKEGKEGEEDGKKVE